MVPPLVNNQLEQENKELRLTDILLGEMADEDYQTKLRELQKYVPFLENTIRRLKAEKDRPREAQISKLQSLLSILTDTKKKLKLDALKKCEEVILKLYDKVEKRPCDMINSNKYRCRTPPEAVVPPKNDSSLTNPSFVAAREKLKRIETPKSPSPPQDGAPIVVPLPVEIPTEKLETSPVREAFHNIPNPNNSPKKIPTVGQHLVGPPLQKTQWTKHIWSLNEPQVSSVNVKKRKDLDRPKEHQSLWKNTDNPGPRVGRELIDYSDIPANINLSPPRNKTKVLTSKKPAKISFKVQKSKKSLPPSSTTEPKIKKPSLVDSDLLGLLSPMTETSSSGDQSPLHPEELSLDKLEALKAKLYLELEESKNVEKGKGKENKTIEKTIPKIVKPVSSKTTEKQAKEQEHNFGSLLSSIDDEIINKTNPKKEKKILKSGEKKDSSVKKDNEKDRRSDSHKKSSKSSGNSPKKEPTSSDFSKKDKKLMENVLKKVHKEDVSKKDKKLMETVLKNVEKSPAKPKNSFEEFSNKLLQNVKDAIKLVNDNKKDESPSKKDYPVIISDYPAIVKEDTVVKPDVPVVEEPVKKDVVPIVLTDSKPRITAADIMRDLEESIGISKPDDPLEKFGDLVKQKSTSLHKLNMNDEIIKRNLVLTDLDIPVSGRLSDKYPHKRKISTDTRICDPGDFDIGSYNEMLSPKNRMESQTMKKADPRLSDPRLNNPRQRIQPIISNLSSPEPNFPMERPNHYCPPNQNHFPPVPPPFTNNFPPGHLGNQNQGFFPNPGRPIEPFVTMGNRTPIDPFLNPGNMTPVDPFLNPGNMTPVETFFDPPKPPPLMSQTFPPPIGPNFPNNFNNLDQRVAGNIWDRPPACFESSPQNIFQNNFNKNQNNPRFAIPGNQYDLSQGTPLDFFDQNQDNPEFNRGGGFRGGRGGLSRGGESNFNKHGRGDSRPHNKFIPDNRRNKTDRGINRDVIREVAKDVVTKDDSYNKRSSKYNDPRLFKDKDKDEYRNNRKSVDERSKSSSKSVPEVVKKPETTTVTNKPEVESISDTKKTENNYSPLDSLYSGVTKTIGKGYGLQNFKIPKIKKPEVVVEIKKDTKKEEEKITPVIITKKEEDIEKIETKKPVPPPVEEAPEKTEKETEKEPEKIAIEEVVLKREVCSPDEKREESDLAQTSKEETESNADEKLDMFNKFMKHIFDTCNSSVLLDYLDKCGFSLPQSKTKKIRRIIESDSSESEEELSKEKSTEDEKPVPETVEAEVEEKIVEEIEEESKIENESLAETSSEVSLNPEPVIESVGERIKNRRRKNIIYSSDSSPEKQKSEAAEMSPPQTPEKRVTRKGKLGKKTEKQVLTTKKSANKTTRRKNALELLQDDIREMFISKGVITATGKRMCRLMKEHQEIDFNSSQSDIDSPVKQPVEGDEEEIPLAKRKPKPKSKLKATGKTSPKPIRIMPKRNSASPRVVLEKLQFIPPPEKSESEFSSVEEEQSEEEIVNKAKKQPVRKLPTRVKKPTKLTEKESDSEDVSPTRKPVALNKPNTKPTKKTSPELSKEAEEWEETDESDSELEKEDEISGKPTLIRKKMRKRKGNNWSAGVVKRRALKKTPVVEKPPAPVADPVNPTPSDDLEIDEQEVADLVADASQDLEQLEQEILSRIKEKSEQPLTADKEDGDDHEFDLLKADLTPDMEYYLHGTGKFDCKLCNFKGRYIVNHYKTVHPESENMISRLSPDQARAAVIEAEQFSFADIVPYDEIIGGKKRRTNFMCRICTAAFKDTFVGGFYDHVTCHTGEHRFLCKMCGFNTGSKRTLHAHCETKHPQMKRPISVLPSVKGPPNFRIVFGYLCKACNFVQLLKENVEKHVKTSHPEEGIEIVKISMSSQPVPLTGLQTGKTTKTPAEIKKEILPDYKNEEEDDEDNNQTATKVAEPEKTDEVDMEDLIKKTAITKVTREKSCALRIIKVIRKEEEKIPPIETIPEPQKETNMTAFMVSESEYSEQEKQIESDRLKKMQEVHNNINPKRSSLNVVNRLQNKLATILGADDSLCQELQLLESMEDDAAHKPLEDTTEDEVVDVCISPEQEEQPSQQASVSSLTESEGGVQSNQWLSISSACSLATGEQIFDASIEEALASESQTQSSDTESNSEEIDLSQVDLPLTMDNKQKGVFDTIHRLAAQLKSSPTAPSPIEETDNSDLYYKPPEAPPLPSPPSPTKPPQSTSPINLNLINGGLIEIVGSNIHQIFRYKCKAPGCSFQSRFKKHFTSHLSDTHKDISMSCPICAETGIATKPFNMMNIFVHLLNNHISNLNTTLVKQEPVDATEQPITEVELPVPIADVPIADVPIADVPIADVPIAEPPPPQPGTIRIRRISGDVLSSFSVPKPVEVVPPEQQISLENQEVFLHIPDASDTSSENSSDIPPPLTPFLQISDVRTLTPEEENHLQSKIAEETTEPNKKPIKTYKPAKALKVIDKAEVPESILKSQKIQKIDLAKDSTYFNTHSVNACQNTKSNAVMVKMLKHPQILDLYKCPMSTCAYSTSLKNNFNFHFNDKHKDAIAFDLYCVYCNSILDKTKISNHIDEEHGYCGYQCMHCFYRALTLIYVSLHQKSAHNATGNPKCYSLLSPPTSVKSFDNILPINQAIQPYVCNVASCRNIYFITSDYTKHLLAEHSTYIYCSICIRSSSNRYEFTSIPAFLTHLLEHKIGRYQCRYCVYGAESADVMLQHYTTDHCNKQPVSYLRKYMKKNHIAPSSASIINLETLLKVNLEQLLQASISRQSKQFKIVESKDSAPAAKSYSIKTYSSISTPTPVISSVVPLSHSPASTSTSSSAEKPSAAVKTANAVANQVMIEIVDESDLQTLPSSESTIELSSQESSSTEVDKVFHEPLVTLKHRSDESRTAIENAIDPLDVYCSETDSNLVDLSEDSDHDVLTENAINCINFATKLSGTNLFRCGNAGCVASFENGNDFQSHVLSCDISKNLNGAYMCYHCNRQWKFPRALLQHIMQHAPSSISCSICGVKDSHARAMRRHFKIYHKVPCRLVPVDPKKTTIFDNFVCEPISENTDQESPENTKSNVQIVEEPLDEPSTPSSELNPPFKNLFGPEDIDRLPRPPVYAVEVKCKVCSYATKVRSNILKHLKAHFENKAVSEQAPVNPVPCLEKNEMMFEKMVNLAASSQTSRMGGKKKDDKPESKVQVDNTYPGFIPINKRYVCGAINCNYLTHGEAMLRHHLTALHLGENSYKCPHCELCLTKMEIDCLAIDKIMFHLKMHDLYLYHCSVCQYYHYQKHKINRHILDAHKNVAGEKNTEIVRELDSSANVEETRTPLPLKKMAEVLDVALEKPGVLAWRCGFCPFKCSTRAEMVHHCTSEHKIKSQYKCGLCHFKCSVKQNYTTHFKTKHPNEKVNFVSSYYKLTDAEINSGTSLSQQSSVDELSEESDKSFDTTPLWVKNKTGIKHIRGILLDDSKATTTPRKIPKVIEKLNELKSLQESSTSSIETITSPPLKTYSRIKGSPAKEGAANMSKDVVRLPDTYGNAYQNFYCCPSCQVFKTQKIKEFINHIYEEINYYRFVCTICGAKFLEMSEASTHFAQTHKDEKIVTGKTLSVMRFNGRVEKWIEKCLKEQQQEVEAFLKSKPETLTEAQDLNSSTETLILNLDDDEDEEEVLVEQRISLGKESSDDDGPSVPLSSLAEMYRLEKIKSGTLNIKEEAPEEIMTTTTALRKVRSPEKKKTEPVLETPPVLENTEKVLENTAKVLDELPSLPPTLEVVIEAPVMVNPLACEYCDYVARTSVNIKKHTKTHFAVKKYQCDYCSYRGAALNHLQAHYEARHRQLPLSYTMLQSPDKITPLAVKRKRHPTSTDVSEEVLPKIARFEMEFPDEDVCYMCFHCPRKSYVLEEIRQHYLKIHPTISNKGIWKYKKITTQKPKQFKIDCQLCSFSGYSDSLRIHEAQEHAIGKCDYEKKMMHKCNNCLFQTKNLSQIRRHLSITHKQQPFSYRTTTVLNGVESSENIEVVAETMNVAKGASKAGFQCEYCPDTFVDQEQLSNHHSLLHSHLELKQLKQLKQLKEGSKKSSELKMYQCPECSHSSNSYNSMRDHLRSHNKPFSCGHCNVLGSYPNVLKAHHAKEHSGLELQIIASAEAQVKVEKLREHLLYLQPDGTYAAKLNLKRPHPESTAVQPSNKVFVLDQSNSNPQDSFISTTSNVAKKSTSKPPLTQSVAKKSTTPRMAIVEGYSYYGCQPPNISDYKQVTCELPIMGKNMPLQVQAMSQILNLFPTVRLVDIFKTK